MAQRIESSQVSLFQTDLPTAAAVPPPLKKPSAPRADESTRAGGQFAFAVQVALATHGDLLSYGLPQALELVVQIGHRVTIPLRGQLVVGVVFAKLAVAALHFDPNKLRPVVSLAENTPPVPTDLLKTIEFTATYYHCTLGQAVRLALPSALRHTGEQGDDAPERLQPMVQSLDVQPWPDGLTRQQVRILQRVQAEGTISLATLRRRGQGDKGQNTPFIAPQTVLEQLAEQGLVRLFSERVLRDPLGLRKAVPRDTAPQLTPDQLLALERIQHDLQAHEFGGHLLRGVTGSGKTEIYLHAIEMALAQDRGAIVLVPEIALTPLLVQRFRARFGDQVAALHSGMSDGERYDQYSQIEQNQRRIVVGPRSALFAPVRNLGVIVVDECHDSSFKQSSGVRYHARDLALVRARHANAVCIMGSATPGCEEMHLVDQNRLQQTELSTRALGGKLPAARIIDLRQCERLYDKLSERPSLVSTELAEAISQTVARGEQVMLLHNRRGFATSMICKSCGRAIECEDCAISLTWHRAQGRLRCHYCDFSTPVDISCPHCKGHNLLGVGAGTERVEDTLREHLPLLRIARFDRDTATGQRLHDTLDKFARGEIDVLVGTQMLAKGHDFRSVTLVGILLAESGLRVPDFRASERTFQLLTQVAGRAGRGDKPGRVLVQTYMPDHPAIDTALRHDHMGFLQGELQSRQHTGYPPYSHLALIETKAENEDDAVQAMQLLVDPLRTWGAEVRGPVLAGVAKMGGIWRVHALVRNVERKLLHKQLRELVRLAPRLLANKVQWSLDVDPYNFS